MGPGGDKTIRPLSYCEDDTGCRSWRWQQLPVPRPLYGPDRLAANSDAPVLVVEGEKSADAAAKRFLDHVAVTSSGGSNAAGKADGPPLSGRHVVVWPDHDEAGRGFAADVARLAREAGATSVRVVEVPSAWPDRWDLADELPDGVTTETLREMLEVAGVVASSPPGPEMSIVGRATAPAPEPLPLPKLPPVPDFPPDILPDALCSWIMDAADRARFRPEFAAVSSMSALGSVIGRKVGIRQKQKDDWTEYANVWGALIGLPSALKSPAMRDGLRHLAGR